MATHFFDIDGTIVYYHTNEWLPGAKEYIQKLAHEGHQIIFITMRDKIRDKNEIWSVENLQSTILKELDLLGIEYGFLSNVSSPRIMHDDSPIQLDCRFTNQPYNLKS